MSLTFEWDKDKRESNFRKHGVDFADAARIFAGPVVEWLDNRQDHGEDRFIALGDLDGVVILCVAYTVRGDDDEVMRLISARKATRHESQIYHREIHGR